MSAKSFRWMVLVTVALIGLGGCAAAPLAGGWQGIADIGPVAAWQVELQLDADETAGEVRIHSDGKTWTAYRLCRVARTVRAMELEYDAARPGCEAQGPTPSDRVVLRGTVGEAVMTGEVFRSGVRTGFFRAYPLAPAPATSAAPQPPAVASPPAAPPAS